MHIVIGRYGAQYPHTAETTEHSSIITQALECLIIIIGCSLYMCFIQMRQKQLRYHREITPYYDLYIILFTTLHRIVYSI